MRGALIPLVSFLFLGSCAGAGQPHLHSVTPAATSTAPATSPAISAVKRGALDLTVKAAGHFEPVDPFELRIRPKAYQGDLVIVSAVAPGASVAKDDLLLQIDDTQIKRQVAAAENEVANARANYQKAQADVALGEEADALALKMQEDDVKNAESGLKWWENVDGKQMLEGADLSVKNAKDSVGDQEDELDQLRKMYKSEELTSATADIVVKRALRQLDRSKISLRMTEERAEKTKQNDYEVNHARFVYGVQQQKQALDRLKAQQAQSKITRQSALTAAKLALDAAEEKLANIKGDLDQFTVRAPQSMTVFYGQLVNGAWSNTNPKFFRPGEKIILAPANMPPPTVLMTGISPLRLRFVADVPEEKILLVEAGQKVSITPTAMPQITIEGTTGTPSRTAGGDAKFDVPIELSGIDPQIEPGMRGSAKFANGHADDVLLVPNSAIRDGKVWVRQSDGSDKETEVTTGRHDSDNTEIRSGLNEGDRVLTTAKQQ